MTRQSHTTDVGRAEFTPDWLNADVCIENAEIAYEDSLCDEDGPVDTVISSGDLGVLIGLAKIAAPLRDALHALTKAVNTNELAAAMACHEIVAFSNVEDALKLALPALTKARGSHD